MIRTLLPLLAVFFFINLVVFLFKIRVEAEPRKKGQRLLSLVFIPLNLILCLICVSGVIFYTFFYGPESQLFCTTYYQGNPERKSVALTFDDGPVPFYTPTILKTLRRHGVKATFFVKGERVETFPEIAKQIVAEGHEIGNHSFSHRRLAFVPPSVVAEEIERTEKALKKLGIDECTLVRPPQGQRFYFLPAYINERGLKLVTWSVDSRDYDRFNNTPDEILNNVLSQVRNGSIILLHDRHIRAIRALEPMIEQLKAKGFAFETVSQLIE